MKWNIKDIAFLHKPDVFTGTFGIKQMQERHERQLKKKLFELQTALAQEPDPLKALKILHLNDHFQFLINNKVLFHQAHRFEETVLFLYGRYNAPFSSGGDRNMWNSVFSECDKELLMGLGKPIPFTRTTLYRGSISGLKRSLSWTPDRERAQNFAKRWEDPNLGGGSIYEVDIDEAQVFLYRELRHDIEVLVSPKFIATADIRDFSL